MSPDGTPPPAPDRLRVAVFVDHAIIARHFLASGAFEALRARHDVRVVTPPADNKRLRGADPAMFPADTYRLPAHAERAGLWTRIFHIEQLRRRSDAHLRSVAANYARLLGPATARKYRLLGLWPIWPFYRRRLLARLEATCNAPLEAFLDEFKPDVIAHPSVLQGPYLDDLLAIGRARRIPTVVIMNSWDNPALKRSMVGAPDRLLVWGRQTEKHAEIYMGMNAAQVVRFGAAQFEVYREPARVDRAAFRAMQDLPSDATVVLYAGSSKDTDEYAALDSLERAIEDGRYPGAAVLYRPHPWGSCGKDGWRIGERRWKHVRFEASMADYVRRVTDRKHHIVTPSYADTRDLLANVDVVVSPLSTILLEAALMGREPLCMREDPKVAASFDSQFDQAHFQEFLASPVLGKMCTPASLVASVGAAIARARDSGSAERLRAATEWYVDRFDRPYTERLAEFVEALARETSPAGAR
jgi:hypothetical protein